VAGLLRAWQLGVPDKPRAACRGLQKLSVTVGWFGSEAITIPELSGMLPTRMHKETTALRTRTLYLENHFTGWLHSEQVAVVLKFRGIDFCGVTVRLEGKLHRDT
jgi:hypothetical protein